MGEIKSQLTKQTIRATLIFFVAGVLALANIIPAKMKPIHIPEKDIYSHIILINEIAWAGTAANSTHEWIELRNPTTGDISLDGWKLRDTTSNFEIILNGSISGGGYFLIERNEIATNISSDQVSPNLDLSDQGMILELLDNSNLVVDRANSNGGDWAAGSSSGMVCSMERSLSGSQDEDDGVWFTNDGSTPIAVDMNLVSICGSPKSNNSAPLLTATPQVSETPTLTDTPQISPTPIQLRSVIINEVAWMGTLLITYNEWIELHNTTNHPITLDGWMLTTQSGTGFNVPLQGTIEADGYFILARNPNIFSSMLPDQVYEWIGLDDQGISLILYDSVGTLVDTANQTSDQWPAGDAVKACTMERAGENKPDTPVNWLTSAGGNYLVKDNRGEPICGSPGYANWAYEVTPTRTSTPTLTPFRTPTSTPTPTGYRPTSVILNEFLIQPQADHNLDGIIDSGDSFIEIINLGPNRVSLDGWKLDDQAFDSPPYTIKNIWLDGNGGKAVFYYEKTRIFLSSGTDSVRLYNDKDGLIDAKTYLIDPIKGISWCRYKDGYGEWMNSCLPSPGSENNYLTEVDNLDKVSFECDFRSLFAEGNFEKCANLYQWSFSFTENLFGDPIVIDIGPYRLLIK
ncbi:MAG TPA: lamin tail domain-containing protein [Anaerolineales bacterium]|nr:lamin tail domain-containing protein [Anaerolineales bacterium]